MRKKAPESSKMVLGTFRLLRILAKFFIRYNLPALLSDPVTRQEPKCATRIMRNQQTSAQFVSRIRNSTLQTSFHKDTQCVPRRLIAEQQFNDITIHTQTYKILYPILYDIYKIITVYSVWDLWWAERYWDKFYCQYFFFSFRRISIIATYAHFIRPPLRVDYTKILEFDNYVILNISVFFQKKYHLVMDVCRQILFFPRHFRVQEWWMGFLGPLYKQLNVKAWNPSSRSDRLCC